MSDKPTISVVIPAYNAAETLAAAIDSALAQTWPNIEIIVVNDGSTDNTPEIMKDYEGRVRPVHTDNQGLASARNNGIRVATGAWVAILDADDWWDSEKLAEQMKVVDRQPDVAYIGANGIKAYSDGRRHVMTDKGDEALAAVQGDFFKSLLVRNFFSASTMMIRTDAVRDVGGFDGSLRSVEDWELWLRLATRGYEAGFSPEPHTYIFYRVDSLSKHTQRMHEHRLMVLDRVFAYPWLKPEHKALEPFAYAHVWRIGAHTFFSKRDYAQSLHCFRQSRKSMRLRFSRRDWLRYARAWMMCAIGRRG